MKHYGVRSKWIVLGWIGLCTAAGGTDPLPNPPQQWEGTPPTNLNPGWEPASVFCRLYDSKTVLTLTGIVQRIEKKVPMKGMGPGIHLTLKTETEILPVSLGPTWYVEKQPVLLHAQDTVEVTGSRVVCEGKPVILAAVIRRGDETITLRNPNGIPTWAGQPH